MSDVGIKWFQDTGSYPAATLRLLCGCLVFEEFVVSSLEILKIWKLLSIKFTVSFKTPNDSGASNSEPV
jgi:hypothetical protein